MASNDICTLSVYKIINSVDDYIYIGSTTQSLKQRFQEHKNDHVNRPKGNIHNHMRNIGFDKFSIELITSIEMTTFDMIRDLEQSYIDKVPKELSLNKNRAYNSKEYNKNYNKQYKQINKEWVNEINRRWKQNNKEKVNESERKRYHKKKIEKIAKSIIDEMIDKIDFDQINI